MNREIWEQVNSIESIAIAGHIRPDGDCIGSCMALYTYILKCYPEKKVDVFLESIPERFKYLYEDKNITVGFDTDEKYDLFFALDCSNTERLGGAVEILNKAEKVICIDHHKTNLGYGMINCIEPEASSAAEVLFEVLDEEKIDREVAISLYLGIAHDSGLFQYSNTSKRTMEIAGFLMDKGIDQATLIDRTMNTKTYVQNQVLGRVLLESILLLDKKVIASCVSQKMLDFYGATADDLEGIVEQLRATEGTEVAVFVHELAPLEYKVSMRSKSVVDVAKIAQHFGGGGHIRAAGCKMAGTYYDILNSILEQIELQYNL